jgi:hypothetical protein
MGNCIGVISGLPSGTYPGPARLPQTRLLGTNLRTGLGNPILAPQPNKCDRRTEDFLIEPGIENEVPVLIPVGLE